MTPNTPRLLTTWARFHLISPACDIIARCATLSFFSITTQSQPRDSTASMDGRSQKILSSSAPRTRRPMRWRRFLILCRALVSGTFPQNTS